MIKNGILALTGIKKLLHVLKKFDVKVECTHRRVKEKNTTNHQYYQNNNKKLSFEQSVPVVTTQLLSILYFASSSRHT